MKKKILFCLLLSLSACMCLFTVSACGSKSPQLVSISVSGPAEVYIDEFDYSDYVITATYDDGSRQDALLKSEYLSSEDQAKTATVGKHTLIVDYFGRTTALSLTIKYHEFYGVEFNDKTVIYNGLEQTIEVENLPFGANVTYAPSNSYTESGEYVVTATITKEYYSDLTLIAKLKITDILHKITFVQSGYADIVEEVADGSSLNAEKIPEPQEVNGYNVEWERTSFDKVTSDITVGIVKTPKTYTITYVLNGGVNHVDNPVKYTIESPSLVLYTPKKSIGETFSGWYTSPAFTDESKITEIKSGSYGDVTVYAKWLDYRIENADGFTIDYNEQPALVSITVPYVTENIDLGSRFTVSTGCSWKLFSDFTGNSEYSLKAMTLEVGTNKAYIIVFHPDGEHFTRYLLSIYRLDMKEYAFTDGLSVWSDGTIQEGSELSAPETNPSKTGYDFSGWAIDDSKVEFPYAVYSDVVFSAVYTPIRYDIVYNLNGGSLETDRIKYTIEEYFTFDAPTRDYYAFDGWFNNAEFNGEAINGILVGTYGKITLYAKWSPVDYNIVYELNGGTNDNANPMTYNFETSTITLKSPTRDGFTFNGWYTDAAFANKITQILNGSHGALTLYAKWTENVNGLNFDGNGNTSGEMSAIELKTGESKKIPSNPFVKTGYTFIGWATSANSNVVYADGATYTMGANASYTLYAKWQANTNTLNFDGNGATGGSTAQMQIKTDDSQKLSKNGFTRNKYLFAGWSATKSGEVKFADGATYTMGTNSNYTLYAKWNLNENEITFNGNGNTSGSMQNQTVYSNGNKVLNANAFVKAGYHFIGWAESANGEVRYTDGATATFVQKENYTLYARWEANLNTLTFDGNGATSGSTSQMQIRSDATASLNQNGFIRSGYTFVGWAESKNGSVKYSNRATYTMGLNSSYTLYAVWQENVNGLNFNGNGNTSGSMTAIALKTGETKAIPSNSFVKTGYTFIGWAEEPNGEVKYADGATYTMGANASYTLYAKWQANTNTLNFDGNGAKGGSTPSMQIKTDETATLTLNGFTRTGYVFDGWAASANGAVVYADGAQYTMGTGSEYTLYAMWILNENIIVFDGNGATSGSMDNIIIKKNENIVLLNNTYTKTGYHFIGWAESSDGEVKYTDGATVEFRQTEIYTLYAVWAEGSEGLTYSLYNSKYTVTGYTGTDTVVVIPSIYNGYSVTSIGEYAFYKCSSLTSIVIPDSVTSIGSYAFSDCNNLTKVNYTGTIDQWVQIEFDGSSSNPTYYAKNLYINNELVTEANVTTATKINDYAFYNCDSLTSVTIGSGVTSIGRDAFEGCSNLTSITIPDGVTSIGSYAFSDCNNLTKVNYTGTIDQWVQIEFKGNLSNPTSYAKNLYINNELVTEANITTVTKINDYAFHGCDSLTTVTIGNRVTSIGSYAFSDCNNLTKANYTGTIDQWVQINFDGYWSNLTKYNLYINNELVTEANITTATKINDSAFSGCTSLISVTIPDSVTSIGNSAFSGCTSLTSVTIGNSVTSIGYDAFMGCSKLEEITIPFVGAKAGVTSSDKYQYPFGYLFGTTSYTGGTKTTQCYYGSSTNYVTSSTYYIPSSLKKVTVTGGNILYGAFYDCSSLTSITISDSVTGIRAYAFYDCYDLASITIPDSVTWIGERAFSGCSSLTSVTIPDSVTSIGTWAFSGYYTSLTSVIIGNGVTSIGGSAFENCKSLTKVSYTGTIDQWVQIKFGSEYSNPTYYVKNLYINDKLVTEANITSATKINAYAFYNCDSLTSVTIGSGVTSIGHDAFEGCSGLTSITIPDSVTSIGYSAFYGCSSLTSVTIGSGVTSIGSYAFENCYDLASITIGNSVKGIGEWAFHNCYDLTSITIPDSVTSIGKYAFYNCDNLTSVYYDGTVEDWNKISIGDYNSGLTKATKYYYSETEPELNSAGTAYAGNYWHYADDGITPVVWKKEN